jgi:DNA primase
MMNFREAKQLSIVDYLSSIGISPVRIRHADHWYISPFRSEKDPSFKVNDKLNVWYDHGAGIGGTIIDLGMNLHQCSAKEFLEKLANDPGRQFEPQVQRYQHVTQPKIELVDVGQLKEKQLLNYLTQRKIIRKIAEKYCHQVIFRIGRREYSAVGFQNKSGGFELRNHWFKGSTSPKDVSLIKNGSSNLSIVEGFFDMLSMHSISKRRHVTRNTDVLVLNSVSFIKRSMPIISDYKNVNLFFDNDPAGERAKAVLASEGVQFKDRSDLYKDFKDLNDYLRYSCEVKSHLAKGLGMK